jgi:hypothetical protein
MIVKFLIAIGSYLLFDELLNKGEKNHERDPENGNSGDSSSNRHSTDQTAKGPDRQRCIKSDVVQIRNPKTRKYVAIDRERGVITARKKTAGPFKGIPIYKGDKKNERDNQTPDESKRDVGNSGAGNHSDNKPDTDPVNDQAQAVTQAENKGDKTNEHQENRQDGTGNNGRDVRVQLSGNPKPDAETAVEGQ